MKKLFSVLLFFTSIGLLHAQPTGGRPQGGRPDVKGKLYGKVVSNESGKSVEYAVLKLLQQKPDTTSGVMQTTVVTGCLSLANGDFMMENVPVGVKLVLNISLLGFDEMEQEVMLQSGARGAAPEKDLGNIKLKTTSTSLDEVVIDGGNPDYRIEFDKRIYEVDKNPANAGGTAEDVLRNVPSLQVDMDGNVNLRNGSPQIFVDGRPTTLSIDQIPAEAIQRVEVITNPSAKYDAGGGTGGIVNIVMKHNRSMGYNGSLRFGLDSRKRYNGGLDINLREGKFNFFANGNYNQRKSIVEGETDRLNKLDTPQTYLTQTQNSESNGFFTGGKIGVDFFADNRNTFTLSESFNKGQFHPIEDINTRTDTANGEDAFSEYMRHSETKRQFQNLGTSLLYKHLFAEEGDELTADMNFNSIKSQFEGEYENVYNGLTPSSQLQIGQVKQELYTFQSDYTNRVSSLTEFELGIRGSVRHYLSDYDNFNYVDSLQEYMELTALQVNYQYWDKVYAAYSTYSKNLDNWKYQLGLRLESSDYQGELRDTNVTFRNQYPISIFPSLFLTRIINEKQDVQLSLTRRISRPGFMQLSPFTDYTDSLNVSRGNPSLKPEFTHNAELSYQYTFNKKNVFIASAYIKYTTDITIRHQVTTYSEIMDRDIIINTYANANSSTAAGLELVSKNSLTKWMDITTNINLYQSAIDGSNISADLKNDQQTWWAKMNLMVKLPGSITVQCMGDYTSRKALDVGSSERGGGQGGGNFGGGGGGGGMWNISTNSVQGYADPNYGVDFSVKKEFLKNKNASVTLSVSDAFKTRISQVHSESDYFRQDTTRKRDQQVFRLQFGWKFGKIDASLFRRKNTNSGEGGMEG